MAFGEPALSENAESQSWHSHAAWEPIWVFGNFRATGQCEKPSCRQAITVTGVYSVDDASGRTREEGFEETGYVDEYSVYYAVEYFSPPLTLVLLPEGTPQEVCQAVERAARLLYLDPGLAATALRSSVEGYLTSQGVPRTSKSGGFLSLDKRLQDWRNATSHEREADLLLAVKWIGNSGTHEAGELTARDVLDGVRFIDEAFHSLYIAPDVDANAQAVSARRGRSTTQVTTS